MKVPVIRENVKVLDKYIFDQFRFVDDQELVEQAISAIDSTKSIGLLQRELMVLFEECPEQNVIHTFHTLSLPISEMSIEVSKNKFNYSL